MAGEYEEMLSKAEFYMGNGQHQEAVNCFANALSRDMPREKEEEVVKKCRECFDHLNQYPMVRLLCSPDATAGVALIFNVEDLREGAARDSGALKELFAYNSLEPHVVSNPTAWFIRQTLNHWTFLGGEETLRKSDLFVCFIGAHGTQHPQKGLCMQVPGKVKGSPPELLCVSIILHKFMSCEALRRKPKIFLLNMCRMDVGPPQSDSELERQLGLGENPDTLVVFATAAGEPAERDPREGSFFVQALGTVLRAKRMGRTLAEDLLVRDLNVELRRLQGSQGTQKAESRNSLGGKLLYWPSQRLSRAMSWKPKLDLVGRQLPADGKWEGLAERVSGVKAQLLDPAGPKVVGLIGMGGIGKSVTAAAVHDDEDIQRTFSAVCWLKVGKDPSDETIQKTQEWAVEVLTAGTVKASVGSKEQGRSLIKKHAGTRAVLIVLDNVWKVSDQPVTAADLEASGSRILITTRDAGVLSRQGCPTGEVTLETLCKEESWMLFRKLTLNAQEPEEAVAGSMKRVVDACGGLPLCLSVVAAWAKEAKYSSTQQWEHLAKAIKGGGISKECAVYEEEILNPLRASYEAASKNAKEAFVLLLALWKDEDMPTSMRWLEAVQGAQYAASAVDELERRSLLDARNKNATHWDYFKAHDRLRDVAAAVMDMPKDIHERVFVRVMKDCDFPKPHRSTKVRHLVAEVTSRNSGAIGMLLGEGYICSIVVDGTRETHFSASVRSSGLSCSSLRVLTFKNCGLPMDLLDQVPSLISLSLKHSMECAPLPEGISALTGLTSLNLTWCVKLAALPEGISALTGLTSLNLTWCWRLAALPEGISALTGLTSLSLTECLGLAALPEGISALTGLTSLNLTACGHLAALPEGISALTGLTSLDLAGCPRLAALSEGISELTGLTSLDLAGCPRLAALSEGISALTGLTSLDLAGCERLAALPEGISALTGLTSLNLYECGDLAAIPEGISEVTGLTSLNLRGCGDLAALPEGISALTGLTSLDLAKCERLAGLPEGISALTGLTSLDLAECWGLAALPEGISALTGLTSLNLRGCGDLAARPEGISALTGLTNLDLAKCERLAGLPEGISALTGLTRLDLTWCRGLAALPEGISALTGLTSLYLYGCRQGAVAPLMNRVPLRKYCSCDQCVKDMPEESSWYHCETCTGFDACKDCFVTLTWHEGYLAGWRAGQGGDEDREDNKRRHNAKHKFVVMIYPGVVADTLSEEEEGLLRSRTKAAQRGCSIEELDDEQAPTSGGIVGDNPPVYAPSVPQWSWEEENLMRSRIKVVQGGCSIEELDDEQAPSSGGSVDDGDSRPAEAPSMAQRSGGLLGLPRWATAGLVLLIVVSATFWRKTRAVS